MTETTIQAGQPRLTLDNAELEKRYRVALYQVANALVNLTCDVQNTLKLRPEACQVYLVIAVTAVQRYARETSPRAYDGVIPLPEEMTCSISRRRISDVTGIPRETVARHVRDLLERNLVVEVGIGKLTTPPGLIRDISPSGLPSRMLAEFTSVSQRLVKLGVIFVETDNGGEPAE